MIFKKKCIWFLLEVSRSDNPCQFCKLKKTLYGLKETPRAGFEKFYISIYSLGFHSSPHDFALFVRCASHGHVLLSLYIDDMIITKCDVDGIMELKLQLVQQFGVKDLGIIRHFLGIEIAYSLRGCLLSQSKYIANILDQVHLSDTWTKETLLSIVPNIPLLMVSFY